LDKLTKVQPSKHILDLVRYIHDTVQYDYTLTCVYDTITIEQLPSIKNQQMGKR